MSPYVPTFLPSHLLTHLDSFSFITPIFDPNFFLLFSPSFLRYSSSFFHYFFPVLFYSSLSICRFFSVFFLQDVIAAIPPHWNDGVIMKHGTRWAGAVRKSNFISTSIGTHSIVYLRQYISLHSLPNHTVLHLIQLYLTTPRCSVEYHNVHILSVRSSFRYLYIFSCCYGDFRAFLAPL